MDESEVREQELHERRVERERKRDVEVAGMVEALRLALDALTDVERDQGMRCNADQAHDHALLSKVRATIRKVDEAYAGAVMRNSAEDCGLTESEIVRNIRSLTDQEQ
jgi:hypothetical protein